MGETEGATLSGRNYFPDLKEEGNALVGVLGSTPGEANRITFIMYVAAITFAENSLHMTNAYFAPESQIMKALTDAAKRGVDVKIILPGTTDRSLALYAGQYQYSDLLKSGVKLYKRRNVLLHAKTLVIDGVWSTVGSTNMEWWSFSSNDEVNAVILSREFAAEMEKMFAADLAESDQIRREEWKKRPLLVKIREWFSVGALRLNELASGAEITPDNARFFASPSPVVIHIIASAVYALLGALQFVGRLWQRGSKWHRWVGRFLVPVGLLVGLSGLWMTVFYPRPEGASNLLYAFRLLFGTGMVLSIIIGYLAILRKDVHQHLAWMTRAYAIGLGAGTQVFTGMVGALIFGTPNEFQNALLNGAAWVINLAVAEWSIRKDSIRQTRTVQI